MAEWRTGDLLAIAAPPGPRWLDRVRDAWDAGVAILPIDPRLPEPARDAILERAAPTLLESPEGLRRREGRPVPAGTGLAIATSGSTGAPSTVLLSVDALREAVARSAARLGPDAATSWQCPIPVSHIGGMLVVLRGIFLDADVSFAPDPAEGEARWTALVPTQLARLAALGDRLDGRRFLVGGQALAPDLRTRVEALGGAVVATYGMTETAGGIVYDGVPLEGVEVAIGPGHQIALRSPTLASHLRAHGEDRPLPVRAGWFTTRDAGRSRDGLLEVLGRLDAVVNTGGEKVDPSAVEAVLREIDGVTDAVVFGEPDDEWGTRLVARVRASRDLDPATLAQTVRAALGPAATPKRIDLTALD